jgi:hypothetical protein
MKPFWNMEPLVVMELTECIQSQPKVDGDGAKFAKDYTMHRPFLIPFFRDVLLEELI